MSDDMTRELRNSFGDGQQLLNALASLDPLDGQPCTEDCPDCARAQPEETDESDETVRPSAALAAEITAVEAHLGRIDTKAGLLLGLTGAAATAVPVLTAGAHLPTLGTFAAMSADCTFVAAATLLALAIRPRLVMRSRRPHGFMRWAGATINEILFDVDNAQYPRGQAARLADLSAAAVGKYRQIRIAVDLALAGLGWVAVTALTALISAN